MHACMLSLSPFSLSACARVTIKAVYNRNNVRTARRHVAGGEAEGEGAEAGTAKKESLWAHMTVFVCGVAC